MGQGGVSGLAKVNSWPTMSANPGEHHAVRVLKSSAATAAPAAPSAMLRWPALSSAASRTVANSVMSWLRPWT